MTKTEARRAAEKLITELREATIAATDGRLDPQGMDFILWEENLQRQALVAVTTGLTDECESHEDCRKNKLLAQACHKALLTAALRAELTGEFQRITVKDT